MITSINEFRSLQIVNEVRLPHGYFKVTDTFSLPDGEWDMMLNKDNIIEIDTNQKYIKKWSRRFNNVTGAANGQWVEKPYPYNALQQPELYSLFKANTYRLPAEETPAFATKKTDATTQFTTTVKRFDKKAEELGLEPTDKIKVIII